MVWSSISAIVLTALAIVYYRAIRKFDLFEIPYAKPIPFLGNLWQVFVRGLSFPEVIEKIYNSNPDSKYVGFIEFNTPLLLIRDLDLIKSIAVKNFDHFPNHRLIFEPDLDPLFSKNLFSLRGVRWMEMRQILTSAFTSSKMKSMFVLMRDCAKEYADYFAPLAADQSKEIELKDAVCAKPFKLPPRVPGAKSYVVQANESVCIPIYGIHHDPQYYPEPKNFNPDRFYDYSRQTIKSSSFLSFGLGPRMCMGNKFALLGTKLLFFHIFAKCNLSPCVRSSIPLKLSMNGFHMTSENGFWLKIKPRSVNTAEPETNVIPGTTILIEKVPDRHPEN
ncbi:Cytochrome P450 9e2 [Melipona quadrifasciata]|uniref:Cytochrome P450 9e2 n=1 Tax=Melipona quadrifasciata TaxID=166423 RepID=A0A0N0BEA5_9HYME|nr:Cytochrome P450 9e2 [Melipona quadrifasciata]